MNNAIEVHPRSEATATADDEAPDDDNDDDAEDGEESASVFMELDLPQWNSTARRINHSQEETIANGGIVTDLPRKSSCSAFLRRFLMFSLINLSFPVFLRISCVSCSMFTSTSPLFLLSPPRTGFTFARHRSLALFYSSFLAFLLSDFLRTKSSLPTSEIRSAAATTIQRRDSLRAKAPKGEPRSESPNEGEGSHV